MVETTPQFPQEQRLIIKDQCPTPLDQRPGADQGFYMGEGGGGGGGAQFQKSEGHGGCCVG